MIDPIFTQLAAKADKFVPIRPGSDTALLLSMMYVIIDEGKQNDGFLAKHTVAPYLINDATGKFLRMSDLGINPQVITDETTGEQTTIDPVVGWDTQSKNAAEVEAISEPAISGTFNIEGKQYRTAFDYLKDEINKYSPETAAEITEIPVETIVELAHLAADGPVTHRVGMGPQCYVNGVHPSHAGVTLCALTGNIGKPGAAFGLGWNLFLGLNFGLETPAGPNQSQPISHLIIREVMRTGKFNGKDHPIKALYVAFGNPVCCFVDSQEFIDDVIGNMDFIVVADSNFNDTARYADIILPAAQWFEVEEITPAGQSLMLQYSEKAIDPLYESKPDNEIIRLLAEKMGVGQYFTMSNEEYLTSALDTDLARSMGVSCARLKEEKAIRVWADPFIAWENNTFTSPTGRMEFYVENPQPRIEQGLDLPKERDRLPRFFPPAEAWPENPLYEQFPLVLLSERPKLRVHSMFWEVPCLQELEHEPTVKINPVDANSRGIKSGENPLLQKELLLAPD